MCSLKRHFNITKTASEITEAVFFHISDSVIIAVEKMRYLAVFLVGDYRVEIDVLNAAENICLYLRIALLQLGDKMFYLQTL